MDKLVKYRVKDGIAVVTLASPPVNALGQDVRAALVEIFGRIAQRDDVQAVALLGEGPTFCAGADIREADAPEKKPTIADVCRVIEDCAHPVVAGLHGACLGGGAELALAAHYRIIDKAGSIALPDVMLGLVPVGGAMVRLPRLVGAAAALDMMVTGRAINAETAKGAGLVDGIVDGHMPTAAVQYCEHLIGQDAGPRRSRDRQSGVDDGMSYMQAVNMRRQELLKSRLLAPMRVVECVEAAAMMPFEVVQEFSRDRYEECRDSAQSRALRYLFVAERRISPTLLGRDEKGAFHLTLKGRELADRLKTAMDHAIRVLATNQAEEPKIDQAMLVYGFRTAPFGQTALRGGFNASALVQRRIVAALMAEGARIMEEGLVQRPGDIDAIAVHGLGYPRWRGGPLMGAREMGLLKLLNEMKQQWSAESPVWQVPRMATEAAKYAGGFDALMTELAVSPG